MRLAWSLKQWPLLECLYMRVKTCGIWNMVSWYDFAHKQIKMRFGGPAITVYLMFWNLPHSENQTRSHGYRRVLECRFTIIIINGCLSTVWNALYEHVATHI